MRSRIELHVGRPLPPALHRYQDLEPTLALAGLSDGERGGGGSATRGYRPLTLLGSPQLAGCGALEPPLPLRAHIPLGLSILIVSPLTGLIFSFLLHIRKRIE
jgi:hypothetical protein